MSEMHEHDFDTRLLDLHLGHLSKAEQTELRRQIAQDPALAVQDEALKTVFEALRAVPSDSPSPDLPARIAARVRAAGPPPRVVRPQADRAEAMQPRRGFGISLGSLRDIVAVAAVIVMAIGIGVPSLMHMRERSQRLGCTRNLQTLGAGIQQYSNFFNSSLPFVGWNRRDNSWQPSNDPGVVTVPNHRHVYPLLRLAYVRDPRVFVCPTQHDVPMPRDQIQRRNDFLESRNVSYAYQNMAGVRPSANDDPALPIMADDNPLFADGLPLFRWGDPANANSYAHGRAGQNILTLDGRVMWVTTPLSGIGGDNIWILRDVTEYTGREGPASSTDSHLLK